MPDQPGRLDLGAFRQGPGANAFLIKFSYWFG